MIAMRDFGLPRIGMAKLTGGWISAFELRLDIRVAIWRSRGNSDDLTSVQRI